LPGRGIRLSRTIRHLADPGEQVKHARGFASAAGAVAVAGVAGAAAARIRQDFEGGAGDLLRAGMRGRLAQGALRHLVSSPERLVDRQAEEVAQVTRSESGSHLPAVSENRVRVLPRQDDAAARVIGNRPERQHEILRHRGRPGWCRNECLPAARPSDLTHKNAAGKLDQASSLDAP
jgi:hypothetical protein